MASLALVVTFLIFAVFLVGPLFYVLSIIPWLPRFIKIGLGLVSLFIGIWWCLMPVAFMRLLGLLPIFFGLRIINKAYQITKEDQNGNE